MSRLLFISFALLFICSCSSNYQQKTGEIKALNLILNNLSEGKKDKIFPDSKLMISRRQIDQSEIAVLYVELENGQNGTLTPYPSLGVGQTWLGADGITITLEQQGVLKASRGMDSDIIGGKTSMPNWQNITSSSEYERQLFYLNGKNQLYSENFVCKMTKSNETTDLHIFEVSFKTVQFKEKCITGSRTVLNQFFVDNQGIVRKSIQYHSESVGFIMTERLDR